MAVGQSQHDAPAVSLMLEPGPDAPSGARAAIADFSASQGLHTDTLATMMLLVSELVTNAVVHPQVQGPAEIRLTARVSGAVIRVEITDHGSGFTPQERDPSRLDGGYGLYLLDKAASGWGVKQGDGTTVWFEVPRRPAG